jgi:hypothetical protein
MRRAALVAFAALFLARPPARADGLSAPAAAVADGGLRPSPVQIELTAGTGGVVGLVSFSHGFTFASYDYGGYDLEIGGGLRFNPVGPLLLWVAGSVIVAPVGGDAGGGRIAAGVAARFGRRWFVRPGIGVSLGVVGSPEGHTLLLPIEGSVEVGYTWPFVSPYLRVSLGLDPIAGTLVTARGAISVGVSIPIGMLETCGVHEVVASRDD